MASLIRAEKKKVTSPWVREVIRDLRESRDLDVTDILASVQATEDWIQANQASYVAALPQPFKLRTNGTTKTKLFVYTAMKRAGLL